MFRVSPILVTISLVFSLLFAAILSILFYFGIIPLLFNIITLSIFMSIFSLLLITILSVYALAIHSDDIGHCIIRYGTGILILAALLFVTSILAITFPISVGSIYSAIVMFLELLFLLFLLTYLVLLVYCFIAKNRHCPPR